MKYVLLSMAAGLVAVVFGSLIVFAIMSDRAGEAERLAVPVGERTASGETGSSSREPIPESSSERAGEVPRDPNPAADVRGPVPPPGASGLIGEKLLAHAREGIARGWKRERSDAIPSSSMAEGMEQFELIVLESPERIGRELARNRTERDAALAQGEAFALFHDLEMGAGPVVELVSDPEEFGALFEREVGEAGIDGRLPTDELLDALTDGVTLNFGPGAHPVDFQKLFYGKDPFPRDVTIAGAGRRATLLVLSNLSARSPLRNLTIRDCIVLTHNGYAFDLRTHGAVLRFRNVHFVGFDIGAGGSCLFGLRSNAVYATNCIIEGGYGRSPSSGVLFDVRTDAHLARFEGCELIQVKLAPYRLRRGATVVFSGCRLEDILDRPEQLVTDHEGLVFVNSPVTFFDHEAGDPPAKDLDDLFPGWREALR